MTSKYDPVFTCCVCGKSLPGTRAELVARGCATLQGNGQIIFHCNANRHTRDEIRQAINKVPRFEPASKYRKSLI